MAVRFVLRRAEQGTLTPPQRALLAPTKPEWELYDLARDPWELDNCVDDPTHADLLALDRPRKHYQWYYSTRPAADDMIATCPNCCSAIARRTGSSALVTPRILTSITSATVSALKFRAGI